MAYAEAVYSAQLYLSRSPQPPARLGFGVILAKHHKLHVWLNVFLDRIALCLIWNTDSRFSVYSESEQKNIKEKVHSEMKISDKIELDPNIMSFSFFFSKSVSIPSAINSGPKISLPGPAL